MKYLNNIGLLLLFAFLATFIIAANSKNFYAFAVSEVFAFAGIFCIAKGSRKTPVS